MAYRFVSTGYGSGFIHDRYVTVVDLEAFLSDRIEDFLPPRFAVASSEAR